MNMFERANRLLHSLKMNLTDTPRTPYLSTPLNDPIIVYQFGKVGSSSIRMTLKEVKKDVYHCHYLSNLEATEIALHKEFPNLDDTHLGKCKFVRQLIDTNPNNRWKVITGVRDPIGRSIAAFFQVFDQKYGDLEKLMAYPDYLTILTSRYLDDFVLPNLTWCDDWFDNEIKKLFAVDLFAYDFPAHLGYQIIEGNNIDVLTIRVEDLSACWDEAIYKFLGIKNLELKTKNTAEEKVYGHLQKNFCKKIAIPPEILDIAYKGKTVSHFYTEAERKLFRARWSI